MKPTWQTDDGSLSLYKGDCRLVLPSLDTDSFTACVTDPPYELGFMGKKWDGSGVTFRPETWAEVLRVLKPGAHLLAFGGTRTYHRICCAIEDAGFEIRDCIMWIYGSGFPKSLDVSKAIDKAAGAERSGTGGKVRSGCRAARGGEELVGAPTIENAKWKELTAPATEAARQWNGYGTAMKPAVEPIIWATKPLPQETERRIIVENLSKLEARLWLLLSCASAAETNSRFSPSDERALSIAQWTVVNVTSTLADLSAVMGMSPSASAMSMSLSTVSSWKNILAESSALPSTSIIETKSSTTIDWRTLNFCLSRITPACIIAALCQVDGLNAPAEPAARYFAAVCQKLSATRELSALESAIERARLRSLDADDKVGWEPIIVARKPLAGTVAANCLEHGCGALNIDGCRIGTENTVVARKQVGAKMGGNGIYGSSDGRQDTGSENGRWPANVIHDGSEEVLAGFPQTGPSSDSPRNNGEFKSVAKGRDLPHTTFGHADSGGSAARFFYCAKASKSDRGDGNTHPTVKPLALMSYLVKLVTMPGENRIIDPFAGSGTTLLACYNAFVEAVGIDLEADHLDIVESRAKAEAGKTPLFAERSFA